MVRYEYSDGVLDVVGSSSPIGYSERALQIMIYSKTFIGFLPLWMWLLSRFWEFWINNLKSRLHLNHVPVHETHSVNVRKIITTSKTPSASLNRIVYTDQALAPKRAHAGGGKEGADLSAT